MDRDQLYEDAEQLSGCDPDFRRVVLEQTEPDEFPSNSTCLKVSDLETIMGRCVDRARMLVLKAITYQLSARFPWPSYDGDQSINDPEVTYAAVAFNEAMLLSPAIEEESLVEIGERMLQDLSRSATTETLTAAELAELEGIAAAGYARQGMITTAMNGAKAGLVAAMAALILSYILRLRRRTRRRLGVEICAAAIFLHLGNIGKDTYTWARYKAYVTKSNEPRKKRKFKSRP